MFLTSAWSGTPRIVDTARLMRFSAVLIDGGPGWLSHKRTDAINDHFQYGHVQWGVPINVLMIVASLHSAVARQGVKERSLLV